MQRRKKSLLAKLKSEKGKLAIVDNNIKNLCDQVSCLSENLTKLMESNEKSY